MPPHPLLRLLIEDPATPAPAIVAAAGLPLGEHVGSLLAHPALPDDHPILDHPCSTRDLLLALGSPTCPEPRRTHLLRTAGRAAALNYLRNAAGARAQDVRDVVDLCHTSGPMSFSVARLVAGHPGAPADVVRRALPVLLARSAARRADEPLLVTAATRHAHLWPDVTALIRNDAVRDAVSTCVAAQHPAGPRGARVDQLVATAAKGDAPAAWLEALRSDEPDVAAAAIAASSSTAVPTAVLRRPMLAGLPAHEALRRWSQVRAGRALSGDLLCAAGPALRSAPLDVVRELARTSVAGWELTYLPVRHDFDTVTLDALWDAAQRLSRTGGARLPAVRHADLGAQYALHPAASADLRRSVAGVVLDFGCSAESDRVRWFRPAAVLSALDDVERLGFDGAAQRLPVACLRDRLNGGGAHRGLFVELGRVGLRARADVLADPSAVSAVVALAPTFSGTLGELLDTAAAVSR